MATVTARRSIRRGIKEGRHSARGQRPFPRLGQIFLRAIGQDEVAEQRRIDRGAHLIDVVLVGRIEAAQHPVGERPAVTARGCDGTSTRLDYSRYCATSMTSC